MKLKIILSIAIISLFSCSTDKFNEKNQPEIFLDGIYYQIQKNTTTYLDPIIFLSQGDEEIFVYEEIADEIFQNYFWVIDGDTLRNYNTKIKGYGEKDVEFVVVDIYGDTQSASLTISIDDCVFFDRLCNN
ncbi:hypothetical protein AGMMS49938_10730 [Fibrobacterales bacterium]|nr:hypothetical protein AGMMS49938_10730 [Fibrobacterales bacterium]